MLHEGSSKNKQIVFLDTRNIADRSSMPHELDISFGFDLEEDNDFILKQECETNNAQQITSTYSIGEIRREHRRREANEHASSSSTCFRTVLSHLPDSLASVPFF